MANYLYQPTAVRWNYPNPQNSNQIINWWKSLIGQKVNLWHITSINAPKPLQGWTYSVYKNLEPVTVGSILTSINTPNPYPQFTYTDKVNRIQTIYSPTVDLNVNELLVWGMGSGVYIFIK
jgi:hypothetical protein